VPAAAAAAAGSVAAPAAGSGAAPIAGSSGAPAAGSAASQPPPPVASTEFVAKHGALHVAGGRIVDAALQPLQLRGMSLFWSQWSSFYAVSTVDQLVDDWHAGLVRAALGVEEGGYLENAAENEAKVVLIADRAIERGVYVIIDWHDHHASEHRDQAIDFFTRMSAKYGASPNVIFEIWNEPLGVDWPTVKAYAEPVIAAIRAAGGKNLVLVGTPNWSQDVDVAAESPLSGVTDVAYTLHFYAGTHGQWLRDKTLTAIERGLPLFATEWGTCEANGHGAVSESETKAWVELLGQKQISWANWALNDKDETCSALQPGVDLSGPWTDAVITSSGALVKPLLR
jgi:endoglucanase